MNMTKMHCIISDNFHFCITFLLWMSGGLFLWTTVKALKSAFTIRLIHSKFNRSAILKQTLFIEIRKFVRSIKDIE